MLVVLDTNVLISACWTPEGLEAQVTAMALRGEITPCVSPAVLAEYRDVPMRDKFLAHRACLLALLERLETIARRCEPMVAVQAALDEDDNRLLECAAAAGARYLITGNLKHYPAQWQETQVVNARQFLAEIGRA